MSTVINLPDWVWRLVPPRLREGRLLTLYLSG
jgi:hypothetical protein